jgi:hypothetical protein
MNAIKEAIAVDSSRKAVDYWTREDGYRVKITTRHDKQRKSYTTTISECEAQHREGYTMEYHRVFLDLYRTLNNSSAARYNFNKLQEIHAEIVKAMIQDVEGLLSNHAPIEREAE